MRLPRECYQMQKTIEAHLPHLFQPQLTGLVLWVCGAVLAGGACQMFLLTRLDCVFSSAAAPSRTTGTRPHPAQPSGPPAGAGSSGRGRPGWAAGQGHQVALGPVIHLAVSVGPGPVPQHSVQSALGETPLDIKRRALGHVQGLGPP